MTTNDNTSPAGLDLDAIEARLTLRTCWQCGAVDPPTEDSENLYGDRFDRHTNCPQPDAIYASRVAVHGIKRSEQLALVAEVRRLRGLPHVLRAAIVAHVEARARALAAVPADELAWRGETREQRGRIDEALSLAEEIRALPLPGGEP